jgi:UDP-2-acetamido-3-amino-2,3-dideoxy-glucuronate N-acetyltransferase
VSTISYVCHTGNAETAAWLTTNYPHIPQTTNFDTVLTSEVEAIVIATPITTHYDLTSQALKAHKHVFVEKPVTTTFEEAKKLEALSAQSGKKIFIGHVFLYSEIYEKLQEILSADKPVLVDFEWNKYGTFKEKLIDNLLSHELSLAISLLGIPQSIVAEYQHGICTENDLALYNLKYANVQCKIFINRISPIKTKNIEIWTEKKEVYVWNNSTLLQLDKQSKTFKEIFKELEKPLTRECSHFIKCLSSDENPKADILMGIEIASLLSNLN